MLDLPSLLKGALLGTLTRGEIDRAVEHHWGAGDFVHHLPPAWIPALPAPRRRAKRYGLDGQLVTDVLYGDEGAPGCLLITTPSQGPYDRRLVRLLVPPHTHHSAHITVVTRGHALFLVARRQPWGAELITAAMGPGSLVFYPSGVAHTFASDEEFEVVSLQAAYKEPERPDFAAPSALRFDRLPRVSYEEHRRRQGVEGALCRP